MHNDQPREDVNPEPDQPANHSVVSPPPIPGADSHDQVAAHAPGGDGPVGAASNDAPTEGAHAGQWDGAPSPHQTQPTLPLPNGFNAMSFDGTQPQQHPVWPQQGQPQYGANNVTEPMPPYQQQASYAQQAPLPGVGMAPRPLTVTQASFQNELRQIVSPSGWITMLLMLAVVVGVTLIGAIAVLITGAAADTRGEGLTVGGGIQLLALAWGLLLGGGGDIVASASGESLRSFSASGGATLPALGTLATIGVLLWVLARVRSRGEVRARAGQLPPAPWYAVLTRSAIESAGVALVSLLLALFSRAGGEVAPLPGVGVSSELAAHPFGVFAWVFVIALVAMLFGRLRPERTQQVRVPAILVPVRETFSYLALSSAVLGVLISLVAVIVFGVKSGHALIGMALLPYSLNVGLYGLETGSFGRVVVGTFSLSSSDSTRGAYAWDIAGWWALALFIVMIVLWLFLAVFIGARRARTGRFEIARVWQLPAGVLLAYLFLALALMPLRVHSSGMSLTLVGPSWESLLLVPVFAALVSLAAEGWPMIAYNMSPAFLSFLAGKRAAARWMQGAPAPQFTPQPQWGPQQPAAPNAAPGVPGAEQAAPFGVATAFHDSSLPQQAPSGSDVPGAHLGTVQPLQYSEPLPLADGNQAPGSYAQQGAPAPMPGAVPVAGFGAQSQGYGAPASFGTPAPQIAPAPLERRPMSKKAKRALWLWLSLGGTIIVLVAAGLITVSVLNSLRDPAAQVRTYMDLLADGKYTEASDMVDPGLRNNERALLTDGAVGKDGTGMKVVSVETTNKSDGSAEVIAKYRVDGEQVSHTFEVKAGEKEYGLLNTWKLEDPLLEKVTITAPAAMDVVVGSVGLKMPEDKTGLSDYIDTPSSLELSAYPGVYKVAAKTNKFYDVKDQELRVLGESASYSDNRVTLEREPSDDLKKAVLEKVKDRAQQCVTIPTNMDSDCPYQVQRTNLSNMTLVKAPDGFESFTGSRFTTNEGSISTTRNPSTFDPSPTPDTSDFSFYGSYEVKGDEVTVKFR